jgi:hypothetical protein
MFYRPSDKKKNTSESWIEYPPCWLGTTTVNFTQNRVALEYCLLDRADVVNPMMNYSSFSKPDEIIPVI